MVDGRPLFQVLVEYDANLLSFSDFAICRGDSCLESYPLGRCDPGRLATIARFQLRIPKVELYWPDRVMAGAVANCERYLDERFCTPSACTF